MRPALTLLILLVATSASSARELRPGANHHLGDDSFVARFDRAPTPADPEALRMHVHLEYVRDLLAARPATAPDLAARRAELLGYLGDYIAAGITPKNTYVPWRSPVFIDAGGRICAVGYLIERSVGRALPERIAAAHRLAYLEDIAAALPEVAAWVAASGLSLDELASIQPGYEGPDVQHVNGWYLAGVKDGKVHRQHRRAVLDGQLERKQMVGAWSRTSKKGELLGSGTFEDGTGTWTSLRPDGTKLAEGPYVRSRPEGEWRFFHPSGRVAAVGPMHKGKRDGDWTFFYDADGSPTLATGWFAQGETVGDWQHFDPAGRLVATASGQPWGDTGLTLNIEPGADGVRHTVTQAEPASGRRIDAFFLGKERLYIFNRAEMFDADGNRLEREGGAWTAQACNWTARRKRLAAAGDVWTLYKVTGRGRYELDGEDRSDECSDTRTPLPAARARRLNAILASRKIVHTPIPAWSFEGTKLGAGAATPTDSDAQDPPDDNPRDLATYLADHMAWYIEWPHVDATFLAVYGSLPGY